MAPRAPFPAASTVPHMDTHATIQDGDLWDAHAVAHHLGVSVSAARRALKAPGAPAAYRIGARTLRWKAAEVREWRETMRDDRTAISYTTPATVLGVARPRGPQTRRAA